MKTFQRKRLLSLMSIFGIALFSLAFLVFAVQPQTTHASGFGVGIVKGKGGFTFDRDTVKTDINYNMGFLNQTKVRQVVLNDDHVFAPITLKPGNDLDSNSVVHFPKAGTYTFSLKSNKQAKLTVTVTDSTNTTSIVKDGSSFRFDPNRLVIADNSKGLGAIFMKNATDVEQVVDCGNGSDGPYIHLKANESQDVSGLFPMQGRVSCRLQSGATLLIYIGAQG